MDVKEKIKIIDKLRKSTILGESTWIEMDDKGLPSYLFSNKLSKTISVVYKLYPTKNENTTYLTINFFKKKFNTFIVSVFVSDTKKLLELKTSVINQIKGIKEELPEEDYAVGDKVSYFDIYGRQKEGKITQIIKRQDGKIAYDIALSKDSHEYIEKVYIIRKLEGGKPEKPEKKEYQKGDVVVFKDRFSKQVVVGNITRVPSKDLDNYGVSYTSERGSVVMMGIEPEEIIGLEKDVPKKKQIKVIDSYEVGDTVSFKIQSGDEVAILIGKISSISEENGICSIDYKSDNVIKKAYISKNDIIKKSEDNKNGRYEVGDRVKIKKNMEHSISGKIGTIVKMDSNDQFWIRLDDQKPNNRIIAFPNWFDKVENESTIIDEYKRGDIVEFRTPQGENFVGIIQNVPKNPTERGEFYSIIDEDGDDFSVLHDEIIKKLENDIVTEDMFYDIDLGKIRSKSDLYTLVRDTARKNTALLGDKGIWDQFFYLSTTLKNKPEKHTLDEFIEKFKELYTKLKT